MPVSPQKPGVKIGYVLRKFPVLSETFILNEILGLEAQGVNVHILSMAPTRDARFHEDLHKLKASISYVPNVFDLKMLWRYNIGSARRNPRRYLRALCYAVLRCNPVLAWRFLQGAYVAERAHRLGLRHLHAHFATRPTTVAFFASMITGVPYSFTGHAYDIFKNHAKPKGLAKKLEKARFAVTVSDFNKAHLERLFDEADGKIVRIYNGIDLTRFVPNGVAPQYPFTILAVARLQEKKGLPVLIEACRHLRDRGISFRCWIVGKGRQRALLDAMIKQWELGDRVSLLGPQTQHEVLERYRSAHLYVLPCIVGSDGNRDGLPVSIVEALACGLPVVATPVTGIPEVVHDGQNGLLVAERDPVALAGAIESVINDPRQYERLRANARASVACDFDRSQTATSIRKLFEEPRT